MLVKNGCILIYSIMKFYLKKNTNNNKHVENLVSVLSVVALTPREILRRLPVDSIYLLTIFSKIVFAEMDSLAIPLRITVRVLRAILFQWDETLAKFVSRRKDEGFKTLSFPLVFRRFFHCETTMKENVKPLTIRGGKKKLVKLDDDWDSKL